MPASFEVVSSTGTYDVTVAAGSIRASLTGLDQAFLIADQFFTNYLSDTHAKITFLEASEFEKSLDRMPQLIEAVRTSGANRGTQLIAVGGGIIQDLSAFVASVYMRGLTWVLRPHDSPRHGRLLHRRQVQHQRRLLQKSGRHLPSASAHLHRSNARRDTASRPVRQRPD